jgi:hypothetical protein
MNCSEMRPRWVRAPLKKGWCDLLEGSGMFWNIRMTCLVTCELRAHGQHRVAGDSGIQAWCQDLCDRPPEPYIT